VFSVSPWFYQMATADDLILELQRQIFRLAARVDYLETLETGAAAAAADTLPDGLMLALLGVGCLLPAVGLDACGC